VFNYGCNDTEDEKDYDNPSHKPDVIDALLYDAYKLKHYFSFSGSSPISQRRAGPQALSMIAS
jgi:hypothetical protein